MNNEEYLQDQINQLREEIKLLKFSKDEVNFNNCVDFNELKQMYLHF